MKKAVSVLLALFLICSLFASCDKKPKEEENKNPGLLGPLTKYDPPITLTYVRPFYQDMINTLNDLGETTDDNVWTKAIKEDLGINLELEWVVNEPQQYFVQLTGSIASSTYPDFANVGTASQAYGYFKNLKQSDLLADLTDAFENFASQTYKDTIKAAGEAPFYPCMFDGKIMGIPQFDSAGGSSKAFYWIRKDWLDTLGLDVPETMDELFEVAKQFTEKDPDNDGENNTTGFALDAFYMSYLSGIFNGFHSYPDYWVEKNGKLEYGSLQPETKQAIAFIRELYKNGCIPQNFTEIAGDSGINLMYSGKAGIMCSGIFGGSALYETVRRNPNAQFVCTYLVSNDNKPVKVQAPLNSYFYYAVNSECKNPEAVIKLVNYYIEKYTGSSEEFAKFITDSKGNGISQLAPVSTLMVISDKILSQDEKKQQLVEALNKRDSSKIQDIYYKNTVYPLIVDYLDNNVLENWIYNVIHGAEGSIWMIEKYRKENLFAFDKYVGGTTEGMQNYMETLQDLEYNSFASIITGNEPLDAFEQFVASWYSQGGDVITEEVNDWYKKSVG